jgi:uncharacterized LabA/DUF88 family protein
MRALLIVDGSNLYHRLKELRLRIDYEALARHLRGEDELVSKRYYVGKVRARAGDAKAIQLMTAQQKLLSRLRQNRWNISEGYLLSSGDGRYHEKGVDVRMANDIVLGAVRDEYDKLLLLSSDNDLLPAVMTGMEEGKHVRYIGFTHRPSYGLIKHCSSHYLMSPEDLCQIALV